MTTIRDVAKIAQVSVATVSRVLNGSPKVSERSREAVLQAQKKLGFYLNANARALAQRDSHTIGVMVSDVSDPYFGTFVRACEDMVHASGYNLIVAQGYHSVEREKRAIDDLLSYQCRGLVIHALALDEEDLRAYMQHTPYMILVNRVLEGFEERCITCDNYKGQRLAVDELINKGHTKIAYVGSSHNIHDSVERLNGYLDSMHDHGLDTVQKMIAFGEPSLEGGSEAATELLARYTPGVDFTAVACYSDVIAAGVMAVFHQHGYECPRDVSITGFDNLYLSRCLIPQLTTVDNPVINMAEEAVSRSISLYEGKPIQEAHHIPIHIIQRESVRQI